MKNIVLLELARRWKDEAKNPTVLDGHISAEEVRRTSEEKGSREAKRECADALEILCTLLPD